MAEQSRRLSSCIAILLISFLRDRVTSAFSANVAIRKKHHIHHLPKPSSINVAVRKHHLRRSSHHLSLPNPSRKLVVLKSSQSNLLEDDEQISNEIKKLMAEYDPILLYASKLLPSATAKDASALYAWCRRLDEITDNPDADSSTIQQQLAGWEDRFDALTNGQPSDQMDAALTQCLQRNEGKLTEQPFRDMIAGMKSDAVDNNRTIDNMEELELYCYQVAGTVGCMLLPLLNADVDKANEPAIALGKAIQLINILRDAKPDAQLGRIYLPQDMLRAENCSNEDILSLKSSNGYCRAVQTVAERAHELLMEAEIGSKSTLPGIGPLFVQIIVELYRGYLVKLKQMNYDNLNAEGERVKISSMEKVGATIKALTHIMFSGDESNELNLLDEQIEVDKEENLNKFRSLMGTLYGVAGISHAIDCFFGPSQLSWFSRAYQHSKNCLWRAKHLLSYGVLRALCLSFYRNRGKLEGMETWRTLV